jgi:hypothetical protein
VDHGLSIAPPSGGIVKSCGTVGLG